MIHAIQTRQLLFFLLGISLTISPGFEAMGATYTSTASGGDWNSASTWTCNCVPTATDDVIIASGATVTTSAAITRNAGVTTTVNGALTLGANFTGNVALVGGTLTTTGASGTRTVT